MPPRLRRSALFLPGANLRAVQKARSLDCDCVLFDLEDSVAPSQKALARDQVAQALREGGYGTRELVVRINPLDQPEGAEDLRMAIAAGAHAVLLPKVESAETLAAAAPSGLPLWAMIETPLAILRISDIAAFRPAALALGPNDLVKATGLRPGPDRALLLPWLLQVVLAARAHGTAVLDGVFNAFADTEGFRAECRQGRDLGFDGKTLIHPSQIADANAAFAPTERDADWARRVVAAFALAENAGRGVIALEGEMVERLHLAQAENLLAGLRSDQT